MSTIQVVAFRRVTEQHDISIWIVTQVLHKAFYVTLGFVISGRNRPLAEINTQAIGAFNPLTYF